MSGVDTSELLSQAAPVFAALGHETRLRIAVQLGEEGPHSISDLAQDSGVSRQAVTKHLTILAGAGLAHGHRQGREHIWELDPDGLLAARLYLDQLSRQWDETLDRLKAFVESSGPDEAE